MIKLFDTWNQQKKDLDQRSDRFFFKEAEIWRTAVGLNVGSESCGKGDTFRRPVLIIKKLSFTTCIAVPLTSQEKIGSWYVEIDIHLKKSRAMIYQIRMMSTNRFQRRMAVLDTKDFLMIKEKLKLLLEL